MPPRISLTVPGRVAFHTRPMVPRKRLAPSGLSRAASDEASKVSEERPAGTTKSHAPHVSEEQAQLDKVMGKEPLHIEEQGTPVQEILQRDKEAQDKAPKVIKQDIAQKTGSAQSRSYSTSARRLTEVEARVAATPELVQFEDTRVVGLEYPDTGPGHKFPLPDKADFKKTDNFRRRYDGVVNQVTKSLMRHGKLSQAQANMARILDTLRTAPPPQANISGRKLLSDDPIETEKYVQPATAREALPFSPIQYLTSTIDSVAPLVKLRQQKGILGGGASLPIPVPLQIKQRRRTAIQWILDSASSRKETKLADRVAKEIINVAEGKSSAWEKRAIVHKTAISARSNVRYMLMRRRKF